MLGTEIGLRSRRLSLGIGLSSRRLSLGISLRIRTRGLGIGLRSRTGGLNSRRLCLGWLLDFGPKACQHLKVFGNKVKWSSQGRSNNEKKKGKHGDGAQHSTAVGNIDGVA